MNKNMPRVAGGLKWAHELRERLDTKIANFAHMTHPCKDSLEAKQMRRKYDEMVELLSR